MLKSYSSMDKNLFSSKSSRNLFSDDLKERKKAKQLSRRPLFGSFESEIEEKSPYERLKQIERKEFPQKTRYKERRREFTVFAYTEHRERKKVTEEIRKVREELYLAIKEMEKLGVQVRVAQRAVFEEVVDPGVYHLGFFEKLQTLLKVLRQNIHDSKNWLEMVLVKKRRRKYWNQARTGGSMFTMSHERRLATQAG